MAVALPACYHGAMSKRECEELLGRKNKDGAYLIRESESIQGALCLCVYKQRVVYTYRILQAHNGYYTLLTAGGLQETYFKTLDDLIRNYKRKNQGLAIHLSRAVKKKTPFLIQPPHIQDTHPEETARVSNAVSARVSPGVSARASPGVSARASPGVSARASPGVSARKSPGVSPRYTSRAAVPLPEEDNDYENTACSDYVEVLPE
ncbi:PREDICTED: SH2 domain-containing protein 1B-like [Cyprinodon variegatus]|uniref:SH2 domain-containing protein 1B-like n=1 Tax=Cyprinodon variegatus TaxID=28743 RepID=A0A3Q2G2V3_CYPVA|nr:PREDICTED: SH2 domain-containing protein 1B-like [Cyprinodon variegatus]